jgi:hypothetical protein
MFAMNWQPAVYGTIPAQATPSVGTVLLSLFHRRPSIRISQLSVADGRIHIFDPGRVEFGGIGDGCAGGLKGDIGYTFTGFDAKNQAAAGAGLFERAHPRYDQQSDPTQAYHQQNLQNGLNAVVFSGLH